MRVASIVAWGGVGKSALVNAWLRRMDEAGWRSAQKVFGWSFYSQGTDRLASSDEFIDVALRWFGDRDPTAGSPWDKGERLAALVREERTILVLDGVEPLQWGPGVEAGKLKDPALEALVKELGAQNKGLCLITSRIAMTDLDALSGGKVKEHGLEHLSDEAGAELLEARGAKGLHEELQAAAKEYEGHSLALKLLGTYLRSAYGGDIRKRDLLPPTEGKPARRMMAVYERWFETKPELAVLRMLGLFDRPAEEDEIAAIRAEPVIAGLTDALEGLPASAWNRTVTTLRDVGLLAAGLETEDDGRLDAHPLVREYFGAQLEREQPEAFREGHRRLYVCLQKKAKPLPETIEEMAPLHAAVMHGCRAGLGREALHEVFMERINHGRESFNWGNRGAFGSQLAVLSAFFDPPWERLVPGLDDEDASKILSAVGHSLRAHARLSEAEDVWKKARKLAVDGEVWKEAAKKVANLCELAELRGDLGRAEVLARESIDLVDRSLHAFQRVRCRTTLAVVLHALGSTSEADAWLEEAMRMQAERMKTARSPEHPLLYSHHGARHNEILVDQGRYAEALERARETRRWNQAESRWVLDRAFDDLSLGRAHLLGAGRGIDGDLALAVSHLEAAVDGLRRVADRTYLPPGLLARAALRTHTRTFPLARRDLDEALTLSSRHGFRLHECDAHLGLARLSLAEGNPAAARPHLDRARYLIETTGYHRRDAELADLTRALDPAAPPA